MKFFRLLLDRALNIEVNAFTMFSNLLIYLGSFGAAILVASEIYSYKYCSFFTIEPSMLGEPRIIATEFLCRAILSDWHLYILILLLSPIIAAVFFIATTILRPLYGYLVICFFVFSSILTGGFVGSVTGELYANKDWYAKDSSLQKIILVPKENSGLKKELLERLEDDTRLLAEDSKTIVILFALDGPKDNSNREVHRILKSELVSIGYKVKDPTPEGD